MIRRSLKIPPSNFGGRTSRSPVRLKRSERAQCAESESVTYLQTSVTFSPSLTVKSVLVSSSMIVGDTRKMRINNHFILFRVVLHLYFSVA